MKNITIILLLIPALSGCTKFGKNVTVKGRVFNPITGEGISGATIKLQREQASYDGGFKTVKTATSDENGYYELDKLGLSSYRVTCETGDRYDLGFTTDNGQTFASNFYLTVKKGKTTNADYCSVGYGYIQIYIKDTNCFDQNDNVLLYLDNEDFDAFTFNHGLMTELSGCVDILDTPRKTASGKKYFHWTVTKNGISTTYYDTITISENTTTNLNVFY